MLFKPGNEHRRQQVNAQKPKEQIGRVSRVHGNPGSHIADVIEHQYGQKQLKNQLVGFPGELRAHPSDPAEDPSQGQQEKEREKNFNGDFQLAHSSSLLSIN